MLAFLQSGYMEKFLLVFVRTVSLFLMIPVFGNQNIPRRVKALLALMLSFVLGNVLPAENVVSIREPLNFAIMAGREFLVGWILGFSVYLVYSVLTIAGQFVDLQVGLSMISMVDPLSQMQFTVTGNLYYFILLFIVVITRTYYYFIEGLKKSFLLIPLGTGGISMRLYHSMLHFLKDYFLIALQIALLVFFIMLITNAVLGILARTAPQLNMFVVGFPIKLILGIMAIYVTFYVFEGLSATIIDRGLETMNDFMRGLGGS